MTIEQLAEFQARELGAEIVQLIEDVSEIMDMIDIEQLDEWERSIEHARQSH